MGGPNWTKRQEVSLQCRGRGVSAARRASLDRAEVFFLQKTFLEKLTLQSYDGGDCVKMKKKDDRTYEKKRRERTKQ